MDKFIIGKRVRILSEDEIMEVARNERAKLGKTPTGVPPLFCDTTFRVKTIKADGSTERKHPMDDMKFPIYPWTCETVDESFRTKKDKEGHEHDLSDPMFAPILKQLGIKGNVFMMKFKDTED